MVSTTNASEYAETMIESGYVNSGRFVSLQIVLCIVLLWLIIRFVFALRSIISNRIFKDSQ